MTPSRKAIVQAVAVVVSVGLLGGCAAQRRSNFTQAVKPAEQQTLADLQPPIKLPKPATQPSGEAPTEALAEYAAGRDALLNNKKASAIQHFKTAVDLDASSAVVWRDMGYAQIGMDDGKAATAFRQARNLDPTDADSRLQLARLLLAKNSTDDAVAELRLARLSPEYESNAGLAAVVDLLLGQCLEQAHFRAAALECYENVLSVIGDGNVDLRGRPELADVLTRPGILVLRVADLATQVGKYDLAIDLYKHLQQQEPQSTLQLELRLARAEMASGDRQHATRRAFDYVTKSKASPLAVESFVELFESTGGPAAALKELSGYDEAKDGATLNLLRSDLQLRTGDASGAITAIQRVGDVTLPVVRQVVHAYRAAGRDEELWNYLTSLTAQDPSHWPAVERGWEMLTSLAQPHPLSADQLLKLGLDGRLVGARDYAAAKIYASQGRQSRAKELMASAGSHEVAPFNVQTAESAPPLQLSDAEDVTSSTELAVLIDAYRDDPELLVATVADVLRSGQKRLAFDAFAVVSAEHPDDVSVAAAYAQVLAADNQRSSAISVLDRAASAAKSASELYLLSSQYSLLGDDKSAERVLRKAYGIDASSASVCNDLGYLLTDQGRELPFAEELLSKAVKLEPDNAAYLDSLGWLLYKRAKFDDAAKRLEEAVAAATPVDPVVLDHAGDANYQAKHQKVAADRWNAAVESIKQHGANDPQLRLRIEQKLRQMEQKSPVVVAPVAKAE